MEGNDDYNEQAPADLLKNYTSQGIDIIVEKNRGVNMIAKILNLDDSRPSHDQSGALVLLVKVSVHFFEVNIVEMLTHKCIF